jgi:small subunit ribosomal protein S2
MKTKKQKGEYRQYTKKENLLLDREISRLEKFFGGLTSLKKAPEALFIVDTQREISAIKEGRRHNVKIFAVVDSNSDPTLIDYPIPANDDAVRSIKLIVSTFAKAVKEGMELRNKMQKLKI